MITVRGVDIRVGAQLLLTDVSFGVGAGDRVGLSCRNGAGKTTLLKTRAGQTRPATGQVTVTASVGYLPQDPPAAGGGAWSCPGSCSRSPKYCCPTSRPTTSTPTRCCGCGSSCCRTPAA